MAGKLYLSRNILQHISALGRRQIFAGRFGVHDAAGGSNPVGPILLESGSYNW